MKKFLVLFLACLSSASASEANWKPVYVCEGGNVVIDLEQNAKQYIQLVTYDSRISSAIENGSGQALLFWHYPQTGARVMMIRGQDNNLTSAVPRQALNFTSAFGITIQEDRGPGKLTFKYRTQRIATRPKVEFVFNDCKFVRANW